jgi:hypothetical protein
VNDEQKATEIRDLMGYRPNKAVIGHLINDHRTNQQSVMRWCMAFVEAMAEKQDRTHTDPRNQASVDLARKIVAIENRHLPYV